MSKPLFEIHITCYTSQSLLASEVATQCHWKTSEIMRDPILGNDTYYYLTKYATTKAIAMAYIEEASIELLARGVRIVREKIEHIVHDIRYV